MEGQHQFDDLPDDCILSIVTYFCTPRTVATLSATCKRLHALAMKESVWAHHCGVWLDEHHHVWESDPLDGGERVSAQQLLSSLRLPSYRAMMTAFFKLGGSPVGIFHPARGQERTSLCPGLLYVTALQDQHRSSAGGGFLPCPHLIGCSIEWIEAADGFSLKPKMNEVFRVALGPESPTAFTELEFPMVLPSLNLMGRLKHATAASLLEPVTANSSSTTAASSSSAPATAPAPAQAAAAAQAQAVAVGPAGHTQEEEPDERPYWEVDPALLVNTRDLDVEFSAGLKFSESGRRMALEVHLEYTPPNQKPPRVRSLRKVVNFDFKRVLGLPPDDKLLLKSARPLRPPPQTGSMQALLGELQGIWTALYGSHGAEVLQLKMSSDQDMPGLRLEGHKLVGDPNVPSEELSFWVDPTKFICGQYDGAAVASGLPDDRPVIASLPAGFLLLNLHEREDITFRFAACGQINQEPSEWRPMTEPAELILYSDEQGRIDLERFSILWRPEDSNAVPIVPPLLQLMDFQPLRLHERPRWLSKRQ